MGKAILALISLFLLGGLLSVAQPNTRDYAITEIRYEFSEDERFFQVVLVVENRGADAVGNTEVVILAVDQENRELLRDELTPLLSGQAATISTPQFPMSDFPAGSTQTIQVEVGIDSFEVRNTLISQDNIATIDVPIPEAPPTVPLSTDELLAFEEDGVVFLGQRYERADAAAIVGTAGGILIVLWLLTVILRMIFRRPPRMGAWQPPYGMAPAFDQHTTQGRRQAWQQYAQNNLLLAAPTPDNLHPLKLLVGADGGNLTNWKITAMRLSQYDSYGRIARSQYVTEKKWVKRMNKVLRRRHHVAPERTRKMLRPIARGLARRFRKKLSKKNAFLPIALDIRLEGKHGEVRIFFELYQFQEQSWQRLDQWEPMMMVMTQTLQENFTFTMHGKHGNEKLRDFYNRLQDDLHWLFVEMLRVAQPQEEAQVQPGFNVPDTLSGMDPIQEIG